MVRHRNPGTADQEAHLLTFIRAHPQGSTFEELVQASGQTKHMREHYRHGVPIGGDWKAGQFARFLTKKELRSFIEASIKNKLIKPITAGDGYTILYVAHEKAPDQ